MDVGWSDGVNDAEIGAARRNIHPDTRCAKPEADDVVEPGLTPLGLQGQVLRPA